MKNKLLKKLHHGRTIFVAIPELKIITKLKIKSNLINGEFSAESYDQYGKCCNHFRADLSLLFDEVNNGWKSFLKLKHALEYMKTHHHLYPMSYHFHPELTSGAYVPSLDLYYRGEVEYYDSLDDDLPF